MDSEKSYIGMGGWDLPSFQKYFYPPSKPKGFRKLRFYSQYFDHVEVNTTFYNTVFPENQVRLWLDDVADNKEFLFTAKLFRGYTHNINATREEYFAIRRMMDQFQESGRFGGLVIQFPSSFSAKPETRAYLSKLSTAFSAYNLFLDGRHKSWDDVACGTFFEDHRLNLINVDLPSLHCHRPFANQFMNGIAYYRMMGRNATGWRQPYRPTHEESLVSNDRYNYLYTRHELNDLVRRIQIVSPLVEKTFVVFHNDPEANSLVNGFQLKQRLHQQQRTSYPKHFLLNFPTMVQTKEFHEPEYEMLPLFRKCI